MAVSILLTAGACVRATTSTDDFCPVQVVSQTAGAEWPIGSPIYSGNEVAQSFRVGTDFQVNKLFIGLIRKGEPTGVLTVSLMSNSGEGGGGPSGVALATGTIAVERNATTDVHTIDTALDFYEVTLSQTVSLDAGSDSSTLYWIHIEPSYPLSNTDLIQWAANTGNPYSSGRAVYETNNLENYFIGLGGVETQDLLFRVCGPSPSPSPSTSPSGGTS